MPGEIEFRKEQQRRAAGISLSRSVVDEVLAVATNLGLDVVRNG